MQRKTIIRIIKNKVEDWLSTIEDITFRDEIRDNVIVTGGCIASLYLQEKVNDFDIYIKDIKVAKKIAMYYTKKFTNLEVLSGDEKDSLLHTIDGREGAFPIAVKNLKPDQVKIFIAEKNGGFAPDKQTDADGNVIPYTPVFFSPNAISLSSDLQIVLRFTGEPSEIHKNYDFIHATSYFTFATGLNTTVEALESLLSKNLKYQGSMYPLTSIIRIKKFLKRGWNISAGEMLKIMFQLSELDLKDPEVLEEQLIGVDIAYFGKLIEILSGVSKDKISSEYINAIIDKVFNEEDSDENGSEI